MLLKVKADSDWLGDISYVNTSAVTSTVNQHIHHPGAVTSNIWYVVTAGIRVGIFVSWCVSPACPIIKPRLFSPRHDAAPYVKDLDSAIHYSWSRRADAFAAFQHALISGNVRIIARS